MKTFKHITIVINWYDVSELLTWMHDARMPFLSKLTTQNKWVKSAKATAFFGRMAKVVTPADRAIAGKKPLKLDLIIVARDYPLVVLRNTKGKILRRPTKKRNVPYATAMKVKTVLGLTK